MPGVQVTTQTQVGPSAALNTSGQFFVVGLTERGDTVNPIIVRGMADVSLLLGVRVSYGAIWDALKCFFDEGGQQAYVSRLVGSSATKGALTLNDRAGSPVATVRIDAQNAGSWSTQLSVSVENGSLANTYRIKVFLNGVLVEDKNNLANPGAAVTAFANSIYVRAVDLASATAAPNNNPAVLAATALSAGSDDRASLVTADYVTGLTKFQKSLGDGAVAIPGQTVTAIWTGIRDHCVTNNRIGLLSAAQSANKASLLARVTEVDSEWCGLFAPWVVVPDGSGSTRTISPEAYVAACRVRAHNLTGPWRVPAGQIATANTVSDLDIKFLPSDADDLDLARVNVIRTIAGTIRLYGWRSMSTDTTNYWWLSYRDLLNYLVVRSEALLEQYVFQVIDAKGHLLSSINATLVGLVDPIAQADGLYPLKNPSTGGLIDPGYKVNTGPDVNTPASLATNTVKAILSVRPGPNGGLINLTIVKVGITAGM